MGKVMTKTRFAGTVLLPPRLVARHLLNLYADNIYIYFRGAC
jgi:hypothetical protein